jgi:hypothetical protein
MAWATTQLLAIFENWRARSQTNQDAWKFRSGYQGDKTRTRPGFRCSTLTYNIKEAAN